jgi:hypothetical protein
MFLASELLKDIRGPAFEDRLHFLAELIGQSTVDQPVIER